MRGQRPEATPHLSAEQVAEFVETGYTLVPGLLSADRIKAGLDELKRTTGVVPDDRQTWPEGKAGMHVGQDGIAFDRSVCVTPEMEVVIHELVGPTVGCAGLGPILRFPEPGPLSASKPGEHISMGRARATTPPYIPRIFAFW